MGTIQVETTVGNIVDELENKAKVLGNKINDVYSHLYKIYENNKEINSFLETQKLLNKELVTEHDNFKREIIDSICELAITCNELENKNIHFIGICIVLGAFSILELVLIFCILLI